MDNSTTPVQALSELREFATFTPCEQRYIRRSLDIALNRRNALEFWARDSDEATAIAQQYGIYEDIPTIRAMGGEQANNTPLEDFMGKMLKLAAFDLSQDRLASFAAFRFLYERLLGAWSRPWLASAFCGASALPHLKPELRKTLLTSLDDAATMAQGWSALEPSFYPEFIEKENA